MRAFFLYRRENLIINIGGCLRVFATIPRSQREEIRQRIAAMTPVLSAMSSSERIDKWLWCVRVFKTRGLAADACRAGSVEVNGVVAKPARDVRAGEVLSVRQGLIVRTFVVLGIPGTRMGAKRVAEFCEDRTPPEEFEKVKARRVEQFLAREKGLGRPTKRERRALDRFFGE